MEKHMHIIDNEKIKDIKILSEDTNNDMALLFKMFSDVTRLKILQVLINKQLNVCEISYLLSMSHSAISHQLATLKMADLVKCNKNGKEVYYSLKDDHVKTLLNVGKDHVLED